MTSKSLDIVCLYNVVKAIGTFCLIKELCTGDVLDIECCFCLYNVVKAIGIVCLIKEPSTGDVSDIGCCLSVQCGQSCWDSLPY